MTKLEVTITRRNATAAEIAAYFDNDKRLGRVKQTTSYDVCVNSAVVRTTSSNAFAVITARKLRDDAAAWNNERAAA